MPVVLCCCTIESYGKYLNQNNIKQSFISGIIYSTAEKDCSVQYKTFICRMIMDIIQFFIDNLSTRSTTAKISTSMTP
jgi:hypothetical protein